MTPKEWSIKEKSDHLDFTETKSFYSLENIIKKKKTNRKLGKKIFAEHLTVSFS